MQFGLFSSDPFEAFERGYGYDSFNPWTSSFQRPFSRPHSGRRFVSPTFMWDIPSHMTNEDENQEYLSPHRRGKCKKCRPKSPRAKKCPKDSVHEESDEKCSKITEDSQSPEQQMSRLNVQDFNEEQASGNEEEDNSESYESSEEPDMTKPLQEPQQKCTVTKYNKEDQQQVKIPEVGSEQDELSSPINENDKNDKTCEEKEDIKNEAEEKLELIDIQLNKARELVSKEDLSEPKTEKQRLYLTEMLLRCILDLDIIETKGNESVKLSRREAVREIQSYLDKVEYSSS